MHFLSFRTAAPAWSPAVATREATASHTASNTSFAREGHHSVLGAVVQSLAGACRQCHVVITSSTLSARSVDSRLVDPAQCSESTKVDHTVTPALDDSLASELGWLG